jgi:hypothetical protein
MPATDEPRRKPRTNIKPYVRKPRLPVDKNAPKTSAVPTPSRPHLTLSDWLTVVAYHDANQPISQTDVVSHFANRPEGHLIFTQSALSRHLSKKGRAEDQARMHTNPTALSGKRARVVTRPDVEKALVLWVRHMEEKGDHVSGPMLVVKRKKFEADMGVPEEERMRSDGWVPNFCKAYEITLCGRKYSHDFHTDMA